MGRKKPLKYSLITSRWKNRAIGSVNTVLWILLFILSTGAIWANLSGGWGNYWWYLAAGAGIGLAFYIADRLQKRADRIFGNEEAREEQAIIDHARSARWKVPAAISLETLVWVTLFVLTLGAFLQLDGEWLNLGWILRCGALIGGVLVIGRVFWKLAARK